jgi:hypothetical protein
MMGLLTVLPRLIGSVTTKLTSQQAEAVFWIYYYGLTSGYSRQNCLWLTKQMILETGWGGSDLLRSNNNPFGMSCTNNTNSFQIDCTYLPDGNTNAKFKSIRKAVQDRFLWDKARFTEPFTHRKDETYPEIVSERYFPTSPNSYNSSVGNVDFNKGMYIFILFTFFIPVEILFLTKLLTK